MCGTPTPPDSATKSWSALLARSTLPSVRVTLFDHQPHFRQFFAPREFFQESLKPFSQLLDRAWRCAVAQAALGLRTYDPHGHGAIV